MAYVINKYNGEQLVVLDDGTLDTTTSLSFVGRNYIGYGEIQNENFLFLLENFSNANPPARAIRGQLWYDSDQSVLKIYTGTVWSPVGSATASTVSPEPADSTLGQFWYKDDTNQLYVFDDGIWRLIGPEAIPGRGDTKFTSKIVIDTIGREQPVVQLSIDGEPVAIWSNSEFGLASSNNIPGFAKIYSGLNLRLSTQRFVGDIIGNASTATKLESGRTINGVFFDGQNNITLKAATPGLLTKGAYITGNNFDGSSNTTWAVDATPNNVIGKVVARDSQGNFLANIITANNFVGEFFGNVTITQGTSTFDRIICNELIGANLAGNSFSATKLQTGRTINGVTFDGTSDISITVAAENLTGTTLASNVINSNLRTLGTLTSLSINEAGTTIGNTVQLKTLVNGSIATIQTVSSPRLNFELGSSSRADGKVDLSILSPEASSDLGGPLAPALLPDEEGDMNLGLPTRKWNNVYGNVFQGLATSAQYADLAEKYVADADYEPGTVLEFGGDHEVTIAQLETTRLAGVVSTNPAYLMNSECSGSFTVAIALQGRVPCKVIGPVKKGDMLISAGNGRAKVADNPKLGSVIGKSLENFNGNSGVIEVAVGRL